MLTSSLYVAAMMAGGSTASVGGGHVEGLGQGTCLICVLQKVCLLI